MLTSTRLSSLQSAVILTLGSFYLGYVTGLQASLIGLAVVVLVLLSQGLLESSLARFNVNQVAPWSHIRVGTAKAAVVTAIALATWPALRADFLADDFAHLRLFHRLTVSHFFRLFTTDFSQGIWKADYSELRPFGALLYRLQFLVFGTHPVAYHALDIAIHILNAYLVFQIAGLLSRCHKTIAIVAALFFGLSPMHAEAISWISGARADAYPTFFYLLSVYQFLSFQTTRRSVSYFLAWLFFVVGLFSKEILITLPVLLLVCSFSFNPSPERQIMARLGRSLVICAPFLAVLSGYLFLRWRIFGVATKEDGFTWTHLKRLLAEQGLNLRHLLLADVQTLYAAGLVMGVVWIATWLWWDCYRKGAFSHVQPLSFGLLWYLFSQAPLAFTYTSGRHLYLPSVGFYIALAAWLIPNPEHVKTRWSYLAGVLGCVCMFGLGLLQTATAWAEIGEVSRQLRLGVQRLQAEVPSGSWLTISAPDSIEGKYAWTWTLPFALQPPFTRQDEYARLQILEPPSLYCCPVQDWWFNQQRLIGRLTAADFPVPIYDLRWDPKQKRPELEKREVNPKDLLTRMKARMKLAPHVLTVPGWETAGLLWDSLRTPLRFADSGRVFLVKDLIRAVLDGETRSLRPALQVPLRDLDHQRNASLVKFGKGEDRYAVVTPSDCQLSFPVRISQGARFRFGIALVQHPLEPVEARVTFRNTKGVEHLIFFQQLNPRQLEEDRFWQDHEVDLVAFRDQEGEIVLEAKNARASNVPAQLGWSAPEIVRAQ